MKKKGICLYCPECKLPLSYGKKLHCHNCGLGPIDPVLAEKVPVEDKIKGLLLEMPSDLQGGLFSYIHLFRSLGKDGVPSALQARVVCRLLEEILALVTSGYVSTKGHGVDRPVTPAGWADGMARMHGLGLDLPLPSHNYLRAVVYSAADQQASVDEQSHRDAETAGTRIPAAGRTRQSNGPLTAVGDGLSQLEQAYKKAHGSLPGEDS